MWRSEDDFVQPVLSQFLPASRGKLGPSGFRRKHFTTWALSQAPKKQNFETASCLKKIMPPNNYFECVSLLFDFKVEVHTKSQTSCRPSGNTFGNAQYQVGSLEFPFTDLRFLSAVFRFSRALII